MAPDMLTLQEKTSLEGKITLVKASFALKICLFLFFTKALARMDLLLIRLKTSPSGK